MASVLASLFGGGAGQLTTGIAQIINSIKGRNPEDAAKLQELVSKHEDLILQTNADLEKARIDENVKLNDIAGQNVRADAQSGDKWTSRARPTILYVGVLYIAVNFCLMPFFQRWGFHSIELPKFIWDTWGIVATGTVVTRTVDKVMGGALGGAGGEVNMPFGIKLNSKGD